MSRRLAAVRPEPIEPHEFSPANAPVTDSLAICSVCNLPARLCRMTYRPMGKYASVTADKHVVPVDYTGRGG